MWLICFFVIVMTTCVGCNPGRPTVPDDPNATKIFNIAEAKRNTTPDGYLSELEMAQIFVDFDMNVDDCIDMTEFIAEWNGLNLGELDRAVRLFHHADTDKNGCIQKIPDYSRLFYYFDRNRDDRISEDEFKTVWYNLST